MVSTHREVERKYDASPGSALPDLGSVPGVAALSAPEQQELEAVYFDTADLRLAAARITLRRRTGGEDAGWHLKLPLGSGTRDEVRLPLGRAKAAPPRRLRSAVLAFTRGEPLVPVATIRTSRTVRRLLAEDGSHLAEVCDDDVTAFAGAEDHSLLAWREWEVELVDDDGEILDRVGAALESAGAAVGRSPSKLARVLGDRVTFPALPSARRKGPAGLVLQARLAEQVAALKRQDVDVRLDVHDGVHQLRVAMRRLRSALATFRPLVDRERTDPLRDELRWIAGLLGEARDAEVMARRLDREVSGLPVELVLGAVTARIDHTLGTRYREGLARAVEAMESQRYLDLLADLDSLVADPPWTPEADERAKDVVPALLRRDWKRVRTRVAAIEPDVGPQGRDMALHECRKAAKGLRYAAEAAEPVMGKRARRVRRAAKKAQTVLGEHQDTVVTRQALREMGVGAQLDGDSAFTFGLLYGREERRAAALQEEFVRAWESELGPALRRGVP